MDNCQNCQYWQPKYHGVGQCTAEGMPNSKFWVLEQKQLLTIAAFSCQSQTPKTPVDKDIL